MNEEQVLASLMRNPAFRKALREMLINDQQLAHDIGIHEQSKTMYVWCAEMLDISDVENPKQYYHPIIVPANPYAMDVESMMDVTNYIMLASDNQFKAYEHENIINMFKAMHGQNTAKLIAISEDMYNELLQSLHDLVFNILMEVNGCFAHIDRISTLSGVNSDSMKMALLASIFGKMSTISACFDQEMQLSDSTDHVYHIPCNDEENDEYENDDDEW